MARSISFSDFLKEGALQEPASKQVKTAVAEIKPIRIEPGALASERELKDFWKQLRYFFRSGKKPSQATGALVPALIAPYLMQGNWDTEYPFFLGDEAEGSMSVDKLLQQGIASAFEPAEAPVLRKFLPRLLAHFGEIAGREPYVHAFASAKKEAFVKFQGLEVHGEEGEHFKRDLEKLGQYLPEQGQILGFAEQVPLNFLRQALGDIETHRQQYKQLMRQRRDKLEELLNCEKQKNGINQPSRGFEFADDMIALDKVRAMMPEAGSTHMPQQRRARIRALLEHLDETLSSREKNAHLVINQDLKEHFRWRELFPDTKLSFTSLDRCFTKVEKLFDSNIDAFTEVIISMQKAELELNDKYEPEVHDDFYAHFKWFKLPAEELALFPPVILVTGGAHLLRDGMAEFSRLLSSNKPVNVLALTNRTINEVDPSVDWEDASYRFRQELAALALSHRAAHTLQCAADKPEEMRHQLSAALNSISPAFMHFLVPQADNDPRIAFLKINAAMAARYFPYLSYDCQRGLEWGSRFDIAPNAQAEKDWPEYDFEYLAGDGNPQQLMLPFTYADYKAMTREKVEELFLVPEAMVTENLIPINQYLQLSAHELSGKVPFIWLVDEDNIMRRAALPYMWVTSCQERLDFWNYLQELAGINSYHVRRALAQAREDWEEEKKADIEALREAHRREMEQARNNAATEAMDKLVAVLLNLESSTPVVSSHSPAALKTEVAAEESAAESQTKGDDQGVAEEEEEPPEAWVESFRCTSCNDCIEKFPAIFKYNEDKQAYIEDASQGTYEHLVLAAEACPAACIHPGQPLNPAEPNLTELRERAAKYN